MSMGILLKFKRSASRLKQIREESKKSYLIILLDFYRLHKKIKISFYEYFIFEFERHNDLFRATFLSARNKKKYLELLNPRRYFILARNKYLTHLFLEKAGINKAELYCYYDSSSRIEKSDVLGCDYSSVYTILQTKNVRQCIIKTTESSHGEGVLLVKNVEYNKNNCLLEIINGDKIELSAILKNEPLIFESLVEQTNQFKNFNPTSVNTVRFMTNLLPTGEACIIAIFMKVGRNGAWVDNAGSGGNIDAAVDIETGKIHSVIQFNGWRQIKSVTHHPDNHTQLEGVLIENWNEIKNEVIQFQQSMPFLKAIGWDIAITKDGPVVIEINDFWDETGQLFIGKGWKKEIEECYSAWVNYNETII